MQDFHKQLASHGIPLLAHQLELSLLRCSPLKSGLVEACQELGVKPVAWCALGGGRGRLTSATLAGSRGDRELDAVLQECNAVATTRGVTIEEVAIAWVIGHGAIPVVGTRKQTHAATAANAAKLLLSATEMERLDEVAMEDNGLYTSLMARNAATRFVATNILKPLLQDPSHRSSL
eukprot:5928504-Amphidinium_carterae.1